jgi:hypothetical protein
VYSITPPGKFLLFLDTFGRLPSILKEGREDLLPGRDGRRVAPSFLTFSMRVFGNVAQSDHGASRRIPTPAIVVVF